MAPELTHPDCVLTTNSSIEMLFQPHSNTFGHKFDHSQEGKMKSNTGLLCDDLVKGHHSLVDRGNCIMRELLTDPSGPMNIKNSGVTHDDSILPESRKRNHGTIENKHISESGCVISTAALVALNDAFTVLEGDLNLFWDGCSKNCSQANYDPSLIRLEQVRANTLFDAVSSALRLCRHKNKEQSSILKRIENTLDCLKRGGHMFEDSQARVAISYLTLPRLSFDIILGTETFQSDISQACSPKGTQNLQNQGDFPVLLTLRVITTIFEGDASMRKNKKYSTYSLKLHKYAHRGIQLKNQQDIIRPFHTNDDCSIILSLCPNEIFEEEHDDKERALAISHVRMIQKNVFPHKSHAPKELYTSSEHGKKEIKLSLKFPSRAFAQSNKSEILIDIIV
mmetsp:Transcript_36471/g.43959  ORF Transcript_36471/g.43959 Transcript_36471/m.43959 type:complete len:395 (-) Transcript_36471:229-1413(-)